MLDDIIKVNYEATSSTYTAHQWLSELPSRFAADFETANKITDKEKIHLQLLSEYMDEDNEQQINATALAHPSLTTITHLSVAWSRTDSRVLICDSEPMKKLIYHFLTTTDKVQLWHNFIFDGKHILYHTKKLPKNIVDTHLYSKCLKNNANSFLSKTDLKGLMGRYYGAWALADTSKFNLKHMYDEDVLLYAGTDACATFYLDELIQEAIKGK